MKDKAHSLKGKAGQEQPVPGCDLGEPYRPGYCSIGMTKCVMCGKEYEYPVSGCTCGKSFVE